MSVTNAKVKATRMALPSMISGNCSSRGKWSENIANKFSA